MAGYSQYLQPALRKQFSVAGLATAAGYSFPNNTMQVKRPTVTRTNSMIKKKKAARSNSVKAQILRNIDTHHCTLSDQYYSANATHNTIYTASITGIPIQGTSNINRIGDKIHLMNIAISLGINTAAAAGAYTYRVLLVYSGEEYTPSGLGTGLSFAEVFQPNTGGLYGTLAITNPKAVTVLMDELIEINSIITATKDVTTLRRNIHLGSDFSYQSSAATFGKTKNLYVVVVACVVDGTTGTTAAGTFNLNADMTFKPL